MEHSFFLGYGFVVMLVVLLVFAVNMMHLIDVAFVAHDLLTTRHATAAVGVIIRLHGKDKGHLYDLGSCRGGFIVSLLASQPFMKATGVDISRFRVRWSQIRSWLNASRAHFIRNDFFEVNLADADVVYLYLQPSLMSRLEQKMKSELKSGAMVITNTQYFPNWQPVETRVVHPANPAHEKLYVYIN